MNNLVLKKNALGGGGGGGGYKVSLIGPDHIVL